MSRASFKVEYWHIGLSKAYYYFMKTAVLVFLVSFLAASVFADHNININTADKEALMSLNGIGEVKAQAIIDYRSSNGSFQKKEDIMNVSGIGTATYNNIKDHITIEGGTSHISPPSSPPSTGSGQATPTPSPTPGVPPPSYVPPPEHVIFADAGADRIAVVGADTEFSGRVYGKNKEPLAGLVRYAWNFGDGGSAEGQAVLHRFAYPGRYAVTLQIAQETESASDTVVIEAKQAELSLAALPDGALSIKNLSEYDLDLSRWIVSGGGRTFTLSKGSLILKGATVVFSPDTTGIRAVLGETVILYPNGVLAFRTEEGSSDSVSQPISASAAVARVVPSPSPPSVRRAAKTVSVASSQTISEESEEVAASDEIATSSQGAAAAGAVSRSWMWWLGALALAAGGAGSVYVARRYAKKEWDIIEG